LSKKDTSWLSGQIKTAGGDIIKFEFSMDGEVGGGVVRLVGGKSSFNSNDLKEASSVFGPKMRELLIGGTNLFSRAQLLSQIFPKG